MRHRAKQATSLKVSRHMLRPIQKEAGYARVAPSERPLSLLLDGERHTQWLLLESLAHDISAHLDPCLSSLPAKMLDLVPSDGHLSRPLLLIMLPKLVGRSQTADALERFARASLGGKSQATKLTHLPNTPRPTSETKNFVPISNFRSVGRLCLAYTRDNRSRRQAQRLRGLLSDQSR